MMNDRTRHNRGSHVIISGASSGIGRAITEYFLMQQRVVTGLSRNPESFFHDNDNKNKVHSRDMYAETYHPFPVDFANLAATEVRLKSLVKQCPKVNMLICCAGYGQFADLEQFSLTQMQRLHNVNFLSQALLINMLLPTLKRCQPSKIIVLGSEAGLVGTKTGSMYCATKFALRGFAQSLRAECGRAGVAVTLINPGMVDSPFFDALTFRPGEDEANKIHPAQIADMVAMVSQMENNCVIEEINCQPLKKVVLKNNHAN